MTDNVIPFPSTEPTDHEVPFPFPTSPDAQWQRLLDRVASEPGAAERVLAAIFDMEVCD